ncbi:amino acid/amide ABC transporter membrane protein 1, HAAT family [Marinobacter daqiaonensis]|uniref:Amino acid/amide ABC transporter membrane protein 1, HAAT family n=1 Tax=Marinobacter daqiaonensis TaxID=650891 RepID=A0A1I6IP01_9GAMM|nr:branched-chain amino acid ABC transporter permease [Marinobacter daqiaonensis]SFR68475.1 amino acid/amide ABC transporter membrane protein 1, HAAT family [Marinobacter daqiaonensis]
MNKETTAMPMSDPIQEAPRQRRSPRVWLSDFQENQAHLFLLAAMLILSLAVIDFGTWLVLTISGIAMGGMLFLMASGMTLTFGLMSVLNLAHGAFISLGAFAGGTVLAFWLDGFAGAPGLMSNLVAIIPALLFAAFVAGIVGLVFEKLVIKPVYGDHLKQILVTVGGSIILMQLIEVIWGPNEIPVTRPESLSGALMLPESLPVIGGIVLEKFRLLAVVLGLAIYAAMLWVIDRTRIGILIRAGVESREMVEIQGYRIHLLFLGVFIAGSALAGLGGVMWGMYKEILTPHMGDEMMISVIVVIILGGLGSIRGCFYGALLVGLINLYIGFVEPRLAAVATVGLMVGVLMWRPQGLIPVIKV